MKEQTKNAETVPGTDDAIAEAITFETVRNYLKKDLSIALSCMNAIMSDPDLLDSVAHFMHGRWQNAKHKPQQ